MLSQKYPVRVICDALGWVRSSHYCQSIEAERGELKGAIEWVLEEFPTYGYRRVTKQLQRHGWTVNYKRVVRLMRQMGLLQRVRGRKCKTTDSEHDYPRYPNLVEGLEVVCPNQVWVCDITYVRLHQEFIYLHRPT